MNANTNCFDHRYSNGEGLETPKTGWTDARCNKVTLFIVDYNGCYDNNVVVDGAVL